MELAAEFNIARYLALNVDVYGWLVSIIEGRRPFPSDALGGSLGREVKNASDAILRQFWNHSDVYQYKLENGFIPKFLHQKHPEVLIDKLCRRLTREVTCDVLTTLIKYYYKNMTRDCVRPYVKEDSADEWFVQHDCATPFNLKESIHNWFDEDHVMMFYQRKVEEIKLAGYLEKLSKHELFRAKLLFSWTIVENHPQLRGKLAHCPLGTIEDMDVYDLARNVVSLHSGNTALILYFVLTQMGKLELLYDLTVDLNIPVSEEDKELFESSKAVLAAV